MTPVVAVLRGSLGVGGLRALVSMPRARLSFIEGLVDLTGDGRRASSDDTAPTPLDTRTTSQERRTS